MAVIGLFVVPVTVLRSFSVWASQSVTDPSSFPTARKFLLTPGIPGEALRHTACCSVPAVAMRSPFMLHNVRTDLVFDAQLCCSRVYMCPSVGDIAMPLTAPLCGSVRTYEKLLMSHTTHKPSPDPVTTMLWSLLTSIACGEN